MYDHEVCERLIRRWAGMLVGGDVPHPHHDDYAASIAAQDHVARRHLRSIRTGADRTTPWDDLPLGASEGPSANLTRVADRLRTIAVSRATPAGTLHGSQEAAVATAAGIALLLKSAYNERQQQYGNWWDWEIGVPKSLGDTCALLGDTVPAGTLDQVLAAVDHFLPDPTRMLRGTLVSTGANRVNLCQAVALRGALGKAPGKLSLASRALAGVLDPVLVGDGFHADGSFVMHTCVAYPGTYGQSLVKGMVELIRLLAGTQWEVAANERDRTVRAVEKTFLPLMPNGVMADSVRGRAISRHGKRDTDDGFLLSVDVAALADALPAGQSETAARLRSIVKGWLRNNTYRLLRTREPVQIATVAGLLADDSVPSADGPTGHFAFADMERIAHRRQGWTYCLALNSDRIARYEYMNQENARGWHTGDGMAQVHLDSDPFQYTDDYWPTVDAKRLPGITVDTAPLPVGAGGDNDHHPLTGTRWSGMVQLAPTDPGRTAGNETGMRPGPQLGLAGMDLCGIDSPMRARTSWLFLDDAVLAAGSGISTRDGCRDACRQNRCRDTCRHDDRDNACRNRHQGHQDARQGGRRNGRRLETIVDNRSLHSPDHPLPARLTVNGEPLPDALGETVIHPAARWAHVDGVGGYVFLDAGAVPRAVKRPALLSLREDRTGRWRDLNPGGPATAVTRRYLTLWHDHGTDPSDAWYAHLLLPGASFAATAARARHPGVEILELSHDVHAFRSTPGGLGTGGGRLTAVNFFTAGSAAGITADGPCAVLLLQEPGTLRVAVSDPSRTAAVVTLEVDGNVGERYPALGHIDPRLTVLGAFGTGARAQTRRSAPEPVRLPPGKGGRVRLPPGKGDCVPLPPEKGNCVRLPPEKGDCVPLPPENDGRLRLLAETGGSHGATLTAALTSTGTPAAPRTALLLRPIADATVRGGAHSGETDGSGTTLTVRRAERRDHTCRAHLLFDVPESPGEVQRAVLWIRGRIPDVPDTRADDMRQTSVRAHGPSGTGWAESDLTWDNAPHPGPPLGSGRLTTYDDWTGVDVTAALQRVPGGPLSLVLAQDRPGHEVRLNSREAASDGPLLEVLTS